MQATASEICSGMTKLNQAEYCPNVVRSSYQQDAMPEAINKIKICEWKFQSLVISCHLPDIADIQSCVTWNHLGKPQKYRWQITANQDFIGFINQ